MKRIAVACNENKEVEDFEHCKEFEIYETESGQVEKEWTINNKQSQNPDYLPLYLTDIGVKVIIADSMDSNSNSIFHKRGVTVFNKAHGDVEDNVEAYLDGKLQSAC